MDLGDVVIDPLARERQFRNGDTPQGNLNALSVRRVFHGSGGGDATCQAVRNGHCDRPVSDEYRYDGMNASDQPVHILHDQGGKQKRILVKGFVYLS
jgi:hypothetical protein